MAVDLTPPNLIPTTAIADVDLLTVWPSVANGPLSRITWANFKASITTGLSGTVLLAANNLSDLGNPTAARTNLGLGSAALASIGTFGNVVPVLNANNIFGDANQIMQNGTMPIATPLHLQNSNNWTTTQGTQLMIDPTSSGAGALVRSMATAAANNADLSLWTKTAGTMVQAVQVTPGGQTQLIGTNAGGITNPLIAYNAAAWAGGAGAEIRVCPMPGAVGAVMRSQAPNATSADLSLITYNSGVAVNPIYCTAAGAIQLTAAPAGVPAVQIGTGAGGTAASQLELSSGNTGSTRQFRVASGLGEFAIWFDQSVHYGGTHVPNADAAWDFGTSSFRVRAYYASNGTIQTSDLRDKRDVEDLAQGLQLVERLRPVSYRWKTDPETAPERWGLIAQEVLPLIGDAALVDGDEDTRYGMDYAQLVPVLINAVQELAYRVRELEGAR